MYCKTSIYCILVYFLYNYAKNSHNPGKSALMIMVNVIAVIFFGKSEKNIWVLDFFNYNHKYRISKTVETDLFVEQYHRATAEQFITVKHLEQYHSQSMEQQNRYNSYYSYNTYNVKQSNRITANHLERYHSITAKTD